MSARHQYSCSQTGWSLSLEGPFQDSYNFPGRAGPLYNIQLHGPGGYAIVQSITHDVLMSLADAIYRMAGQQPIILPRPVEVKPEFPKGLTHTKAVIVEPTLTIEEQEIKARMLGGK